MLETRRLVLRMLEERDGEQIIIWRNQKEIINQLFSNFGIIKKQHDQWFESYVNNSKRLEFIIETKENKKPIGTVGLNNIDYKNQKAELGILIGEFSEQSKGYGFEAISKLLVYAFNEMNMQKISLQTFYDNIKAINLYKKNGFKEDGVLRNEIYKNGKFKDVIVMSLLREEWKES